jgi:hypothetical protein
MVNLFLMGLIVVMPPGICPCWLNSHVETYHIHLSKEHAESEHSHNYLYQLSQSTFTATMPLPMTPASLWLALLSAGSLWWLLAHVLAGGHSWKAAPPLPPPKTILSFL